jgi:hypothetical protein
MKNYWRLKLALVLIFPLASQAEWVWTGWWPYIYRGQSGEWGKAHISGLNVSNLSDGSISPIGSFDLLPFDLYPFKMLFSPDCPPVASDCSGIGAVSSLEFVWPTLVVVTAEESVLDGTYSYSSINGVGNMALLHIRFHTYQDITTFAFVLNFDNSTAGTYQAGNGRSEWNETGTFQLLPP